MSLNQELIDEYLNTRMEYDEAHAISSQAYAVHQAAKAQLVQAMLDAGEQSVKFAKDSTYAGLTFFLRQQFGISCTEKNEEDIKAWLHEKFGDVHEFTAEKVVKKRVEERLKTDIEGGELDEFDVPDFFNLKTRPDVTVNGYKQFAAMHKE